LLLLQLAVGKGAEQNWSPAEKLKFKEIPFLQAE
jgi:hypothetical protein